MVSGNITPSTAGASDRNNGNDSAIWACALIQFIPVDDPTACKDLGLIRKSVAEFGVRNAASESSLVFRGHALMSMFGCTGMAAINFLAPANTGTAVDAVFADGFNVIRQSMAGDRFDVFDVKATVTLRRSDAAQLALVCPPIDSLRRNIKNPSDLAGLDHRFGIRVSFRHLQFLRGGQTDARQFL